MTGEPDGADRAEPCIFCEIVAGRIPSTEVERTPTTYAFRDINPAAPVHVLVVPTLHVGSVHDLGPGDATLLSDLMAAVQRIAEGEGVAATGYRLVANVGADAGQTVAHLHLHVLGGRPMRWPPE